jgi:hypothetical protein
MTLDGLAAFWWSVCYLPDKDSTPCWLTWERIQEARAEWDAGSTRREYPNGRAGAGGASGGVSSRDRGASGNGSYPKCGGGR